MLSTLRRRSRLFGRRREHQRGRVFVFVGREHGAHMPHCVMNICSREMKCGRAHLAQCGVRQHRVSVVLVADPGLVLWCALAGSFIAAEVIREWYEFARAWCAAIFPLIVMSTPGDMEAISDATELWSQQYILAGEKKLCSVLCDYADPL